MIDEQKFQEFYQQTARRLRAYVARVLGDPAQADDIVQESYLRFMRSPPSGEDSDRHRSFLFRIASNLLVDHWRRGSREPPEPEGLPGTAGALGPDIALRLDMERVFMQLTPQQRQLLWLAYVEEADHRQIAALLGLRERSVRVLLHRARYKLANLLQEGKVV